MAGKFSPEDVQALFAGLFPMFVKAIAEMGMDDEPEPEPEPATAPAALDEAAMADDDLAMAEDDAAMADDDETEADLEKYDASVAGSDNTFVPGMARSKSPADDDLEEDEEDRKDKVRMSRDQAALKLTRYERKLATVEQENAALRQSVAKLERYNRRNAYERELIQIEAEGFELDRAEELAHVEKLPQAAAKTHFDRIRSRYRRSPVGHGAPAAAEFGAPAGMGAAPNAEERAADIAYATAHGIKDIKEARRRRKAGA